MKRIVLCILFLLLAYISWSQNGYRNLTWGMSMEDVEKTTTGALMNDWTRDDALIVILFYLNSSINWNSLENRILHSLYNDSAISAYNAIYQFENNKLNTVIIPYVDGIIQQLEESYGIGRRVNNNSLLWVDNNKQRYIINYRSGIQGNYIAFVDIIWSNNRYNRYLTIIQKRLESILD